MASYPLRGLRIRIAFAVAASYAFLLAFATAFLYFTLERRWFADVDQTLATSAQAATAFFATELVEYGTPDATVVHVISELVFGDRTIVAINAAGTRLARSRPMADSPDLWHADLTRISEQPVTLATPTGPARVIGSPIARGYRLAIGFPLSPVEERLRYLRLTLGFGFLICFGLGTAVAMVMSRRALVPVIDLAREADRVSEALGSGVVPTIGQPAVVVPDEVGRLQTAFGLLIGRLEEAIAKEREVASSQRRFFGDAAHELRTPVAIIRNEIDTALQTAPPGEQPVLAALARETDHLGRLVGDLLLLARGETRTDLAHAGLVGLDDVTSNAIMRAGRHPAAAGREIVVGEFEIAPVRGDATLLERAVLALIENALLHAAPSNVFVSVGVDHTGGAPGAWVRVRDEGPAIPMADRERIFERFVRLRRDTPGSGLGLAIVRWIADIHGGTLTLHQDDGAADKTFQITFPFGAVPGGPG